MGGRITLLPKLHCMGEGPGEPGPPLFFDQIFFEKKKILETAPPPPYLRVWMTAPTSLSEGLDLPH